MKWETFLGEQLEGFFNKHLSGKMVLGVLVKDLEREITRNKRTKESENMIPNDYTLFMNEKDYSRLCSGRVLDTLYETALRKTIRENFFMNGHLRIRMKKDAEVEENELRVTSSFTEETPSVNEDGEPQTLVLERRKMNVPLNLPTDYKLAMLVAKDGAAKGSFLEFGAKDIFIGRREQNDFILVDGGASRVHAYIAYERHRHVLCDAKSTNGTFLNGTPIKKAVLNTGDEIKIGNTTLFYEVIG